MSGGRLLRLGTAAVVVAAAGYLLVRRFLEWPGPVNPVTARGPEVDVLDFSEPFPLDPPPPGWWHRRFWTRPPMEVAFAEVEGVHGLRCRTDGSGSIFGRHADVRLADHPLLEWRWRVDDPVETELDERTVEGDDHPARLFLRFRTADGDARAMEIIWSNGVFRPGEYKYIGDFPHYVAESGTKRVGRWLDESVDLERIYREIWSADEDPRVTFIGVFCDTDDTGGTSEATFATVRMVERRRNG